MMFLKSNKKLRECLSSYTASMPMATLASVSLTILAIVSIITLASVPMTTHFGL